MSGVRAAPRGRIDKRQAILDAAFTVFARQGYANACVQEIAAEAGVAKPTVYNHLDNKETLFREAMAAAATTATARNLAAVDLLRAPGDDLRAAFEEVARQLLRCSADERSRALWRLLNAELTSFPDLLDVVWGEGASRVTEALADRIARLALAGRLRVADPSRAAEQLSGLLMGPIDSRSRLGTRTVSAAEIDELAVAAVDTFLAAFGPR
ncbi:TetR/AcrR family transcriptional regulator [Streptomyces hainanensis]|uniref:TetR/AcrR family transcriptional regulator n=1 Tax=Streptomyces hainanensis TaxID=402648 RepID=UPI001A9F7E56|nr:TetR/AcrR family transcriptional regulator [Streptomyces hainanensis]